MSSRRKQLCCVCVWLARPLRRCVFSEEARCENEQDEQEQQQEQEEQEQEQEQQQQQQQQEQHEQQQQQQHSSRQDVLRRALTREASARKSAGQRRRSRG